MGFPTVAKKTSDFFSLRFGPLSRHFAYIRERLHFALAVLNAFEG
jgi:hypothetical protein